MGLIIRQTSILTGLALAVVFLSVPPATADWLVIRGGDPVETDGPWEVKGKLVVFTLPGGALSSMRLVDVDLDASERLTAREKEPAAITQVEADDETGAVSLVLTDADVSHVGPLGAGDAARGQEAGAEAQAPRAGGEGLAVSVWSQTFDDTIDGIVVTGTLENRSEGVHTEVTLLVLLYDTDGGLAGRAPATLDSMMLPPGRSATFRAAFPGIVGFDRPEFRIDSIPLAPRAEAQSQGREPTSEPESNEDE